MSLFYLESSTLASSIQFGSPSPSLPSSFLLGYLGPPFIGKGGALGQPKGSGGVFGGKEPLLERVKETWLLLLHVGPCVVAINL